jgi:hypothetical protein
MKTSSARTVGASILALAVLGGGAVLADFPAVEWGHMCRDVCYTFIDKRCYDYVDHDQDGGPQPEGAGGCTYPPCPATQDKGAPTAAKDRPVDPKLILKEKLICASCRSMCPDTPGSPKLLKAGGKGSGKKKEKKEDEKKEEKKVTPETTTPPK